VDLRRNPFAELRVALDATPAAVKHAFEDRLLDGDVPEADLLQAQQKLLAPRTRLEAEIRWLPGAPDSVVQAVLADVESHDAAKQELLQSCSGLAAANLAAHWCQRWPASTSIDPLLVGASSIDVGSVAALLDGARRSAGMAPVDRSALPIALQRLTEEHAEAAIVALAALPDETASDRLRLAISSSSAGSARHRFIEIVIRRFLRRMESMLGSLEQEVAGLAKRLEIDPDDTRTLALLATKLRHWDHILQPAQLLDQSKGIDEQRSVKLMALLRGASLSLANEQGRHDRALEVTRLLLDVFAELPGARQQLEQDERTLRDLRGQSACVDLARAIEDAVEQVTALVGALERSGFTRAAGGPVAAIFAAAQGAMSATLGTEHASLPWIMLRGLAIKLGNEHRAHYAAFRLIEALLEDDGAKRLESKLYSQLIEDHRTLSDMRPVRRAIEAGTHTRSEVRATSDRTPVGKASRWRWWMTIGLGSAVFLWWIANVDQPSRPSPGAAPVPRPAAPMLTSKPPTSTTAPPPAPTVETWASLPRAAPSPSKTTALNREEVRWCLASKAILDILRESIISDRHVGHFNDRVRDYNARCGEFRYAPADMEIVEGEMRRFRSELAAEARQVLSYWSGAAPSPQVTRVPSIPSDPPRAPQRSEPAVQRLLDIASSKDAAAIQTRLRELGYYRSLVDGVWGPRSAAALAAFRHDRGLPDQGAAMDESTQRHLFPEPSGAAR
jgi:hypothetical protein